MMLSAVRTLVSFSSPGMDNKMFKDHPSKGSVASLHKPTSRNTRLPKIKVSASNTGAETLPVVTPAQTRVDILAESLPFIQKFRGKIVVIKYGGAAMKSSLLQESVITDLVLLSVVGIRPVLVHGGGPEINRWLNKLGIEAVFLDGLRVTDASTMEIVKMVLVGKVNKDLVSLINKANATAVGLSGLDGHLFTARPKPNSAQLGFVGDVSKVDPSILRPLLDNNNIPVIASVASDETGQSYNINADTVAGEIAAALSAEKLILLTDVPKVNCCVRSLAQGVRTASIIDGRVPHSLLLEILTDEGAGTMITG